MNGFAAKNNVSEVLGSGKTFLTFAGVETFLLFQQEFPLRELSAFEVFERDDAWQALQDELLRPVADAAAENGCGLITECLVWRASEDYVRKLGYDEGTSAINRKAVERTRAFVSAWQESSHKASRVPVILAADIGPRGDGYTRAEGDADAAYAYHRDQVQVLADADVDLLVAWTITSVSEAVGIVRAARESAVPIIMSATVETDGRLPDGAPLGDFIKAVDVATDGYPLFYMVNCAHPTHLEPTLARASEEGERWLERFRGFRTNASSKSHGELDNSTSLDRGDPVALALAMGKLASRYDLSVVGGCCGTDAEHLRAIAHACASERDGARTSVDWSQSEERDSGGVVRENLP